MGMNSRATLWGAPIWAPSSSTSLLRAILHRSGMAQDSLSGGEVWPGVGASFHAQDAQDVFLIKQPWSRIRWGEGRRKWKLNPGG